jgi:hypothetical protein
MERRHFLKLAFGVAGDAAAVVTSAQAAPLAPLPLAKEQQMPRGNEDIQPAVTSEDEVNRLKPEQVHWHHHHWHRRWHWHRHWRRWHRRHW